MKSLTKTIIVLVIVNLATGNFALAQAESQVEGPAERTARRRGRSPMPPKLRVTPVEPTPPTLPVPKSSFTISGTAGIDGVEMRGLPGAAVFTDENGYYQATVYYGWSGTVRPTKAGYGFEPASMNYTKVTTNRSDDNYAPNLITFIISGRTGLSGVVIKGLSGVVMQGLPGDSVTDENGYYRAEVNYGWSGTVTPTKKGFTFSPSRKRYTSVTSDQTNRNYISQRIGPAPMLGRTGSRNVLVIPATDVKVEDLVEITQDLQVMSHIFDERFKEPSTIKGMFTDFGDFFGRDSRETEAIYIQGYGTLFLMEVNFAFSPPPKSQEKEAKKTEDVDLIWQRARQKIFSPQGFGGGNFVPEEKYSAEKIDQLKADLIRTLRHTANIRNLKPNEWVILTVIGQGRQSGEFYGYFYRNTPPISGSSTSRRSRRPSSRLSSSGGGGYAASGGYSVAGGSARSSASSYGHMMAGMGRMGGMAGGMYGGMEYGGMGFPSVTILTIRAKKSDVDAFAKGELDFEQFQQKVEIFMY
ncbi:MAG: hypothetical protein IIB56_14085 [Planctomycetes bacterium]|nr:hypothetical protein [Planctomycetota bacterium]